ncbi:MAG: NAD(P)/FAD-dependent oxidoreductase, partial [Bacteroidia bacterium]|nr:NAD(P)/FAD-dependent oxidoreductase [Bacteroidia bacterium]
MSLYDVVVIGSGPGGYVAAIRLAQLGKKTAIIERYPSLGGTCLNVGCIPSKALLDSSEHYDQARHRFEAHGIKIKNLEIDFAQMIRRKAEVVSQNADGIRFLMKKNKVDVYHGHGSFVDHKTIRVTAEDGSTQDLQTTYSIVASGSKPSVLKGISIDKKRVITSTEALKLEEIPTHLMIIGGGAIGLELGSVYARLGSKVSVVEYADSIIPSMDRSLGKELQKILKKSGFDFYLDHSVNKVEVKGKTVKLSASANKDGKTLELSGDYCLVSAGRSPYTEKLGLELAGVQLDERGRIAVNAKLETNVPGIYAIGDVVKGPMLAHKAEEEGVFVAETI